MKREYYRGMSTKQFTIAVVLATVMLPASLALPLIIGLPAALSTQTQDTASVEEAVEAVIEEVEALELKWRDRDDAFSAMAPGVLVGESAAELRLQSAPEPESSEPAPAPGVWSGILTWLFSATGLMLIGQLLRQTGIPQRIPGWARPLIGPLLGVAAAALSGLLGFVPDLSILEGVLLGATAAVVFDSAKEAGLVTSTKG